MLEFLEGLVGFFQTAINFIVSLFQNLLYAISSIPKAFMAISNVLSFFPAFLTVPLFAVLGIVIIFTIINHWG